MVRGVEVLLGDVAEIKTGLVLSRKKAEIKYKAKATYKLITLKNIAENGMVMNDSFEEFVSNDRLEEHFFTQEGDVLMRLNYPYTAVYIEKQYSGLLVPSYFAIIKVDQTRLLPEYIAWYLNSYQVKKELERAHTGSRIPSTNQSVLRMLPVGSIALSKQKALVELYRLHQKEIRLYQELIEEKEKWFRAISEKIMDGDPKEENK